jgi:hypothetical protein
MSIVTQSPLNRRPVCPRLALGYMISNPHPSRRPRSFDPEFKPKPAVQEETIKTGQVQIERKTFILSLKENPRGRFLRITEETAGRRTAIIVPAPGLPEFHQILGQIKKASDEIPPTANSAPS